MNIVETNPTPRKVFSRKEDGSIADKFIRGTHFDLIKAFPGDQIVFENLIEGWQLSRQGYSVLPNVPKNGTTKRFKNTKRVLMDARRKWWLADVDYKVSDRLLTCNLDQAVLDYFHQAGIPSNTAFIAGWSSSKFLEGNNKASLHILFLLSKAYNQEELLDRTSSLLGDRSMCEKGRIHLPMPPIFENEDLLTDSYERYFETVIQHGEPLDLDSFPSNQKKKRQKQTKKDESDGHNEQMEAHDFFSIMKDHFGCEKGQPLPWKDYQAMGKAAEELLIQGKLTNRRVIHYWLMKGSHSWGNQLWNTLSFILKSSTLLGKHEPSRVMDVYARIKAELYDEGTGGEAKDVFKENEIIELNYESMKEMTDEEHDSFFQEGYILATDWGCGGGKSFFGIRPSLDKFDPDSVISICHRLAALKDQSKEWDLEYFHDLPDQDAIHECDNLAITIHSLSKVMKNGKIKKRKWVVIDEFNHVLWETYLDLRQRNLINEYDKYTQRFYALLKICDEAETLIISDDSLNRDLLDFFIDTLNKFRERKKKFLTTKKDYISRIITTQLSSKEELILTATALLKDGMKIALMTDNADNPITGKIDRIVQPIVKLANLEPHEYLIATHNRAKESSLQEIIHNQNEAIPKAMDDGLRFASFSPIVDAAWSYHQDDPYKFDAVLFYSSNRPTTAQKAKSMIRRMRLSTRLYYLFEQKHLPRAA